MFFGTALTHNSAHEIMMPDIHFAEIRWFVFEKTFISKERGECFCSPIFKSLTFPSAQWFLKIYPRGYGTSSGDAMSVYLYCNSPQRLNTRYKICLQNLRDSEATKKCTISTTFHNTLSNSGRKLFLFHHLAIDDEEGYLNDGAFLFNCQVEFEPLPTLTPTTPSSFLSRLPFRNITNSPKTQFDCNLMVKNTQIPASTAILSQHSSIFKELFKNQMSDNKLWIDNFDPKLVQKVMNYCHYENSQLEIGDDVEELLIFAEKYRIKGITVLCRKSLEKSTSLIASEN